MKIIKITLVMCLSFICVSCSMKEKKEDNDVKTTYSSVTNLSEVNSLYSAEKVSMLVIGQTGCGWCNRYKEVMNSVVSNYKVNLYYIDIKTITAEERTAIFNSDLIIPAKCSKTGEDIPLSAGFGTPLTLFVGNNKVSDCIKEYVVEDVLVSELKRLEIIK